MHRGHRADERAPVRRLIAAAATVAVAGVLLLSAVPAGAGTPTVTFTPPSGAAPGTLVPGQAFGFLPGESITINFAGPSYGPFVADDEGFARVSFTIGAEVPPGEHPLDAIGDQGSLFETMYDVGEPSATSTTVITAAPPPAGSAPTTAAPAPTTAAGGPDAGSTTPSSAPGSSATTEATPPPVSDDGLAGAPTPGDDGTPGWLPPVLIVVFVVVLISILVWRRIVAAPVASLADPCDELRDKIARHKRWRKRIADSQAAREKAAADAKQDADDYRRRHGRVIDAERAVQGEGARPRAGVSDVKDAHARDMANEADQGKALGDAVDKAIEDLEKKLADCIENPKKYAAAPPPKSAAPAGSAPCCPSGYWFGVIAFVGGVGVVGKASGFVYLWCMGSGKSVTLKFTGTRYGLALGGEASTGVFGLRGPTHPSDTVRPAKEVLEGFEWDVSLGMSAKKALVGLADVLGDKTFRELGSALAKKMGERASNLGELMKGNKDAAKEFGEELGKTWQKMDKKVKPPKTRAGDSGAKGATSGAQDLPTGVSVPLFGPALQVGFWWITDVEVEIYDAVGCGACT